LTTRVQRRLAAIMATDIVGYSRLVDADEAGTLAAIKTLRAEVVDPMLTEHNGRIVKLMGDGALVEFNSVVDAVVCAIEMQKGISAHQAARPLTQRIIFRIGINLGDVVVEGDDLFGDGVNVAARLEQLSPPGGVLISGTAYDQMRGKLNLPLDNMGEQKVKNISDPVRTYSVRMDGAPRAWKLRARGFRRWLPIAVAAVILLALAVAATWWSRPIDGATEKPAIAVLPFDNIGGDEASGRLADGITEDLITDLAGFPDFYVMARNSTAVYAGKPVDVRQVGADLRVRYVLEGSVQRQADQIRVTAQLIDAKTGAHIWSDRWDRPAADVFALQTEIVKQAASRLGGTGVIMEAEHRAAQRKRPGNLSAYEKYLLARERLMAPTKEGTDEAIALFKQVLAEDPKLARAWADLAWAYDHTTWFGADYATAHPLALEAARRAVEMDPMDAAAHAVLANQIAYDGDFAQGKAELDTALRLNPGSANILILAASWASTFGDPERGGELADQAIRLDPNYPTVMAGSFYIAYFMADRYEDALRIIDRQPAENRTRHSWAIRAASYAALDEREKAKAATKEALEHHPDLTAEGFANEPGFNETERKKLAETMLEAGFPACASPEKLTELVKPFRLPECVKA
jgi:TolB-like protein/class 3 adenylate cyclase/tetratricopeptide (TPR) repeat protein